MAKRLTAAFVRSTKPGRYYDEHGLMLRVLPTGAKHWVWRGTVRGRRVDLGLGGYPYTSLAEARQTAFEHRKLARAGGDPRALRTSAPTFAEALEKVLTIQRPSWRPGSKSEAQRRASLRAYALPRLGEMRVDQVTTSDVMAVLLPISVVAGGGRLGWGPACVSRCDGVLPRAARPRAGLPLVPAPPTRLRRRKVMKAWSHCVAATPNRD